MTPNVEILRQLTGYFIMEFQTNATIIIGTDVFKTLHFEKSKQTRGFTDQ